ncbi:MAG: DUF1190 domain-containing protein [Paracoccus sp. (in: a-proteobacteria)]|nr:DUF1190 domain-containing protein [Paracoccus sp. (in: a-proteobacteria)]
MTEITTTKRKRSRRVALFLAGSAVVALAACREEQTDAAAFPDEASCVAAAQAGSLFFTEADCRTQFAAAQQEHLETAPRYESRELCEQEHGAGNCGSDPAVSDGRSGGSIFMPLLMGYMIGSMLGGRGVTQQPLVRNAQGGFSNPSGNASFANNSGTGRVAPNTFTRGATTMGQAPMTQAQVAQRGGFGASSTSSRGGAGRSGGS